MSPNVLIPSIVIFVNSKVPLEKLTIVSESVCEIDPPVVSIVSTKFIKGESLTPEMFRPGVTSMQAASLPEPEPWSPPVIWSRSLHIKHM